MASLKKNVGSQNITFCMVTTSGAADPSATVSVYVVKDNGSQASGGGTVTNSGNGQYNYAPTQAETNATDVGFMFTATGDVPVNLDFHTDIVDANGLPEVDTFYWNGQATQVDANNLPQVSVTAIAGSETAATNVSIANETIGRGTCSSGGSTTSINTSSFTPNGAAQGQFIGRTLIFDFNTTTASLQGQATTITDSSDAAAPVFTVIGLTTPPSAGDTFGVY
jgi:hypothetical protein